MEEIEQEQGQEQEQKGLQWAKGLSLAMFVRGLGLRQGLRYWALFKLNGTANEHYDEALDDLMARGQQVAAMLAHLEIVEQRVADAKQLLVGSVEHEANRSISNAVARIEVIKSIGRGA